MKQFQLKQFVKAVLKEVASPSEPVQPPPSGWGNMDAKAQLEDLIKSADLSERESMVMFGLIGGEKVSDLARKYNVSSTRIEYIRDRAMRKMRVVAKTSDIALKESAITITPVNQLKHDVYKKLVAAGFEKKGDQPNQYVEYYQYNFATVQISVNSNNSNVVRIERYFDNERFDHKNFVKSYPIPTDDLDKFRDQVVAAGIKIKNNIAADDSIFGGDDADLQEDGGKFFTCQKCKGQGHYTTRLKNSSGKGDYSGHGMGDTHIVSCDAPGCQNGKVDSDKVHKQIMSWGLKESSDICSACNGSGEGMADGTRCLSCGGSGSSTPNRRKYSKRNDPDYESPEREDDKRAWGGMDENSEEKERNDLMSQISDDYKSLHGMRPRWDMSGYTIDQLKKMADELSSYIHAEIEQEKQDAIQHDKATKKAMTPTKWNIGDLTGLKEGSSEQPIYKDRQGGQDVYWMDNRDSGGKIHLKPEAVARMVKRGHRVIDINEPSDPRSNLRQPNPNLEDYGDLPESSRPEPYDQASDTFQPSPRERTSQSKSNVLCPKCKTPIRQEKMPNNAVSHYCTACGTDSGESPTKESTEPLPQVKEPNYPYCVGCGKKMPFDPESRKQHLTCPKCLGYKPGEMQGGEVVKEALNTYYTIVILQHDEAKPAIELLKTKTVQSAIDYLKQWDYAGESEHSMNMSKTAPWGKDDKVYKWGKYTLFYNPNSDYIGLARLGTKLKEDSQLEPYDSESDTFQPSPRERTSQSASTVELTSFGQEDDWGRPVYTDKNGKFYVDINLGKGTPSIHSVTDQGEPEYPIKNLKIKTPMKENEGGQHLINGQSNIVAAGRVNKLLAALSRGVFSDNSWEAIHKIFDKLTEAGLEVNTIDAKYGGHADTGNGMPKYKEWRISIPFTNNKGKAVALVGQITAHGAGSVDQPLDRYDVTAMVTPMMVKNQG